ncbi:MAG: DUF481 domain-containing protein [Gammaproteobacteria bacterium]|nr:DUF481 domain-containing protein [Gammaproteobacteria bacterium]MDH4254162.1 DUF481 domain-containing protein [Gammaproteobacteria bacterium]MDH5309956.1 DUF481 domain-containing protein [Gammaproteobacteria bacterium]
MHLIKPTHILALVRTAAACILLLAAGGAAAAKTDVVLLVNGDAVTGEVKSLEFGSLSYGTDSMGTVSVDWVDVVALTSKQTLQVEVTDGRRYFGTLATAGSLGQVRVSQGESSYTLAINDVVRITPIDADESFWERVEGSLTFGFNTQKASEVTTINLAADIRYRTLDYLVGIKTNLTVTDQPSEETKARETVQVNYQRFRGNRWFTDWLASHEKNDEQGIQSRVSAGAALGRYLVQNNRNQFSLTGGVVATRETFVGEEPSDTKPEGRVQVRYLHRSLEPDASASFTSNIYPLLEDLSEYRADTDLSFRREFIKDLFFDLTLWHSYLSDPPPDATGKVDYGITTSIGYSF